MFPRLSTTRRVDVVASHLKRAILNGRVKAGKRLPSEREMASQFGVGRLVIREALRGLESSGLVEVRRGVSGGSFVREATPRQISRSLTDILHRTRISLQDLLEVRLELEGAILRQAARRASSEDLKKLEANVAETKALLASRSNSSLRGKVHEFHILLASTSHNPLYILMMYSVLDVIEKYMTCLRYRSIVSPNTIKEHETIFRFLKARNLNGAWAALRSHITKDNLRLSRRAAKEKLTHIEYSATP